MRVLSLSSAALSLMFCAPVLAQDIETIDPVVQAVETKITSVTLYRGRASVSRHAPLQLEAGLYELHVDGLPESIQPASIQAKVSGGGKVLAVDFLQQATAESTSKQVKELDDKIHGLGLALKDLHHKRMLLQSQSEFIDAVSVRATSDASQDAGTDRLDLDAIRRQMSFVMDERAKVVEATKQLDASQAEIEQQLSILMAQRQSMVSGVNAIRSAAITVALPQAASIQLDLTYLVSNASWTPTYNVRASLDGSTALIEYDAMITQRTGEDWNNVKLALSTAQPMLAANPPALQPWFVDIRVSEADLADRSVERAMAPPPPPAPASPLAIEELSRDAAIDGGGPSVTFQLPRPVTVQTNSEKQQRTRIAAIDMRPKFVHVAVPLLTEAVYIRGELVNASAYQLLPGSASIFLGEDYIGPTALDSVPANGDFKIHFGIDPAVQTSRKLITKQTESTGLLSGGRRTHYEYLLAIDNGTSKPITVELWDRFPVSRNSEIQIELVDVTAPLSSDAYYTNEERPQGLLKWILNVPTTAGQSAFTIGYGVQINRAKDVELTNLPE